MQTRSEADILAKAPIKVTLGAKQYSIPVLTILPSREWRIKFNAELAEVLNTFKVVEVANARDLSQAMTSALLQFPEKVADLLFAYAGESLSEEVILAEASEEQLAAAFSAVMQVAFPYLPQLALATQIMRSVQRQATPPATAKSLN